MTNDNCEFEEWYDFLCDHAAENGGSAADMDAWEADYHAGKTPEEAWADEWGDE